MGQEVLNKRAWASEIRAYSRNFLAYVDKNNRMTSCVGKASYITKEKIRKKKALILFFIMKILDFLLIYGKASLKQMIRFLFCVLLLLSTSLSARMASHPLSLETGLGIIAISLLTKRAVLLIQKKSLLEVLFLSKRIC